MGHSVSCSEHFSRVENQKGVREIASAKNSYADKKLAKVCGKGLQSNEEGFLLLCFEGPFSDQKPEACDGNHSGKKSPEKDFPVGVIGGLQDPERRKRAEDRAEGVHQTFEAKGAAVGAGRHVGGEQRFFRGRANTAAEPCRRAAC